MAPRSTTEHSQSPQKSHNQRFISTRRAPSRRSPRLPRRKYYRPDRTRPPAADDLTWLSRPTCRPLTSIASNAATVDSWSERICALSQDVGPFRSSTSILMRCDCVHRHATRCTIVTRCVCTTRRDRGGKSLRLHCGNRNASCRRMPQGDVPAGYATFP